MPACCPARFNVDIIWNREELFRGAAKHLQAGAAACLQLTKSELYTEASTMGSVKCTLHCLYMPPVLALAFGMSMLGMIQGECSYNARGSQAWNRYDAP